MGERTIIPFGPQHPVLPEPLHLDLILEDEKVVGAVPSIGFVHRGLEKLVEKRDFHEMVYVIERVCGICSFIHGQGYVQTVEGLFGLEVPDRAKFLRTIWAELSRVHSHLLWLGLMADAYGNYRRAGHFQCL
jgi:ech hydrogenase subunit E